MEMKIEGYMCSQEPDRRQLVRHLTEQCIAFFQTEEGEKEYQEWKRRQESGKADKR